MSVELKYTQYDGNYLRFFAYTYMYITLKNGFQNDLTIKHQAGQHARRGLHMFV